MNGFSFDNAEVHVHLHFAAEQLDRIESKLDLLLAQGATTMADLTAITQEVRDNGDAVSSAIALLGSLSQQIRDNATDEAALADLADTLDSQAGALAEAVVANTPASSGGEVPPVEEQPPAG